MLKRLLAPFRDLKELGVAVRSIAGKAVIPIESLFGGLMGQWISTSRFCTYEDFLKIGSKKCWASFKSCDVIGKVVMDTPYQFTRRGGNGDEVTNTKAGLLLANPNPFETFSELLYKAVFHLKLTGNAYWAKDEANAQGDRPKNLFSLNPKRVKPVLDSRQGVVGYEYHVGGHVIPYDLNEVIHFRNPHPDNDFYGLGDIEAGEDLFLEFLNRNKWGKNFWKNGASPSGILVHKGQVTDPQSFELVKAKWKKDYSGGANSGKTALLTGDWEYIRLGLTATEMQDIESSKFTIQQIFHLHGVPLSIAGLEKAANFATARADDLIFRRYTVKPIFKLIRDTLQSDLVDGFDANTDLNFSVAGLIDVEQVVQQLVPLFDRGALSINELRQEIGKKPITDDPLFDAHYINAGLVPLELAGVSNQAETEKQTEEIIKRFIANPSGPRRRLAEQVENGV